MLARVVVKCSLPPSHLSRQFLACNPGTHPQLCPIPLSLSFNVSSTSTDSQWRHVSQCEPLLKKQPYRCKSDKCDLSSPFPFSVHTCFALTLDCIPFAAAAAIFWPTSHQQSLEAALCHPRSSSAHSSPLPLRPRSALGCSPDVIAQKANAPLDPRRS